MRWRTIILLAILFGSAIALLAWRLWRGPDPADILAAIEPPPAPVLSAAAEAETFRLPDGFRMELVASEPLVIDPVAMDWDDSGRLYVVEMRGFMPNLDGIGEDRPVGRVVVLEDEDLDGRMDSSTVFLDGLVLPRAVAVLPQGVLIGSPPDLLLCRDVNRDGRCEAEEKTRIGDYGHEPGNVEHRENGLLPGIDGWIYNAKSDRRFRLGPEATDIEISTTAFRGQWGIAQDDEGLLYSNHNSGFLYADTFPAEYTFRQRAVAARSRKEGLNVDLSRGETVYGVRVAPGLNRAQQRGTLRADGRQKMPTAVSGLAIQRGHQYGDDYTGDAFVPESGGAAVAHFDLEWVDGQRIAHHRRYPDPDFDEREFLASTDERFRPVDVKVGPDGALWILDMYRGVIQHAEYVSDHLRQYVKDQGLEAPGETGRIWRVVREDAPILRTPPSLESPAALVQGIASPNAWTRDRASRQIVFAPSKDLIQMLTAQADLTPASEVARLHTLAQLGALSGEVWNLALRNPSAVVRRTALRLRSGVVASPAQRSSRLLHALNDSDPLVRLEAVHAVGDPDIAERPLGRLLAIGRGSAAEAAPDARLRQAVLSGLAGFERAALDCELHGNAAAQTEVCTNGAEGAGSRPNPAGRTAWISELAATAYFTFVTDPEERGSENVAWMLARIAEQSDTELQTALLEGIESAQRLPGNRRIVLADAPALFADERFGPAALIESIRRGITWPDDPRPGLAAALTPAQNRLREKGAVLFNATCATCHGGSGLGQSGLAPPLAGSAWVRDADAWLGRIILHGLTGPVEVEGQTWNGQMPGHQQDPRFDDATLAGLMTHLRRTWGHAGDPVDPKTVRQIRLETQNRKAPWTAEELLALDVRHRLDRFEGVYKVPIVGIKMRVERDGALLRFGRESGETAPMTEISDGFFLGDDVDIRFDTSVTGPAPEASIRFGSDTVTVHRVDS